MVDLSLNLRMLLQSYRNNSAKTGSSNVNSQPEEQPAQTSVNNSNVSNNTNATQSTTDIKPENKVTSLEAVSKVSTTTNTSSAIFSNNMKSLYNSLLMVSNINMDNSGRVVDYETEFLKTYKSEITSTLYNKIVNKMDLTQEDLAIFEQGISKLSEEDKKTWKDEIVSLRNKIQTSVKENKSVPFSGVKDGVLYQNGSAYSGIYTDGKYYKDGVLTSGTVNGKYYQNGTLANGTIDGKFYLNGSVANGTVNGKLYQNGALVSGTVDGKLYQNGVAFTGTLNNKKYEKGVEVVEKALTAEEKKAQTMKNLGINGELDEAFKQGSTGDCWVLSSLIALNSTEEGKQAIKDAISVDDKGNAVVTFKGIKKSYTITKEEIAKYDTDNISGDAFSNGDNDALVLEIAAAKLRVDLANGKVTTPIRLYNYNNGETSDLSQAAYAGYSAAMLYFMTGKQADWTYTSGIDTKEEVFATLARAKNQMKKGDTVMTFSLGQGTSTAACVDTSTPFSVNIKTGHAFAVTDLNDETITIVNPWDSAKPYTMTWDEFAKLNITQFAFLGL